MVWTTERVADLKRMWADGKSATRCAAALGLGGLYQDGGRNAVIGKVTRLKLAPHSSAVRVKNFREARHYVPKRPQPQKPKEAPQFDTTPLPEKTTWKALHRDPVEFMDLLSHHCRWPIDGTPMKYCGCKNMPLSSYCATHAAKASAGPRVSRPIHTMSTAAPGLGQIKTAEEFLKQPA